MPKRTTRWVELKGSARQVTMVVLARPRRLAVVNVLQVTGALKAHQTRNNSSVAALPATRLA